MATIKTKPVTVSELQRFLRDRGVVVGQSKKQELLDLVRIAKDVGLPVDPDFCVEDRDEVIGEKLKDGNLVLSNPALLSGSSDISILPEFSLVDVCTYLMGHGVGITAIRDYRRSDAYSLMQDGFVSCVEAMELTTGYYAVKASVKPRTGDRDPVTNALFYYAWVLLTTVGIDARSCILSAFCTCKGGMDGCCRHMLAMLYEILDYRQDTLTSVTSGPCLWVRRATPHNQAVLRSDVRTGDHFASHDADEEKRPMADAYTPIHKELPQVQTFFKGLRKLLPESCGLDAFEERKELPPPPPPLPLRVKTPSAKGREFPRTHICSSSACDGSEQF